MELHNRMSSKQKLTLCVQQTKMWNVGIWTQ